MSTPKEPSDEPDVYGPAILAEAPRILGLLDRDVASPTIGCGDRTYWAWKFVDFPASRLQETVSTLAFLYATPLRGSVYHRQKALIDWIGHALRFWSQIQHRDGSFDEAYPYERSLAATAFTTFYVGEAIEAIGAEMPPEVAASTQQSMARAAAWLSANDETHGFLSNHLAAAAAALLHASRCTGERKFEQRAWYFLDRILHRQSAEGWYDEYGGADPGYQTHGSYYLARCWQLTGDERLLGSLKRANQFLVHFIHPDLSIGGEYTSRNTQTYYPAACEMLAAHDAASAWIAVTMRPGLTTAASANLASVDVFNYFPFLNNYAAAYRASAARPRDESPAVDPTPELGVAWFPDAGLARVRTHAYSAFVGMAKGGVINVFDRRRGTLIYGDCGYLGQLEGGASISTQYHDRARPVRMGDDYVEVDGVMAQFARPTMAPLMFVAFRLFTVTVGRLPGLARWLKARLVKTLIYRRRTVAVTFTRRIEFGDRTVRVRDWLAGAAPLRSLRREARFTTIHMGSSRYFVGHELTDVPAGEAIDPAAVARGLVIDRTARVAD